MGPWHAIQLPSKLIGAARFLVCGMYLQAGKSARTVTYRSMARCAFGTHMKKSEATVSAMDLVSPRYM